MRKGAEKVASPPASLSSLFRLSLSLSSQCRPRNMKEHRLKTIFEKHGEVSRGEEEEKNKRGVRGER